MSGDRGAFIVEQASDRAIEHHPSLAAAQRHHKRLEPRKSFPDRPWPHCWRFVIVSNYSPDDCRADLAALSARYRRDVGRLL